MNEITLAQASETCQRNKSTWLTRKSELAEAEREYQEVFETGNDSGFRSLKMPRDIIDVK